MTTRAVAFAGPWTRQAFASPGQTFPNLRPFFPNISKDSFVHFVENQRLAGGAKEFSFSSKFLRRLPVESMRPAPPARPHGDEH
ncbi:MAG: hypothetical protein ABSC25_13190 [Roseiarcus sp.]